MAALLDMEARNGRTSSGPPTSSTTSSSSYRKPRKAVSLNFESKVEAKVFEQVNVMEQFLKTHTQPKFLVKIFMCEDLEEYFFVSEEKESKIVMNGLQIRSDQWLLNVKS